MTDKSCIFLYFWFNSLYRVFCTQVIW